MKTFKFTYHYKGKAYSETIKALTKLKAIKDFYKETSNISKLTNLEIHVLC